MPKAGTLSWQGKAVDYYETLYDEIQERVRLGLGPITPEGEMEEERFRLVVEGPPNWTHFRDFWKMFYDEGAVIVASTDHQHSRMTVAAVSAGNRILDIKRQANPNRHRLFAGVQMRQPGHDSR